MFKKKINKNEVEKPTSILIAKVRSKKGTESSKYKLLLSDDVSYHIPDDATFIPYNPGSLLSENQWYKLEKFSQTTYCPDYLKEPFNSTLFPIAPGSDFGSIDYLCCYQNENEYHFQKVSKTQLVKKKVISFDGTWNYRAEDRSISIKHFADAIYLKKDDVLYFRNLATITSIFKGIDTLYREATDEETRSFLNDDLIYLENGYNVDSVKTMNRKNIALAIDTLKGFSEEDRDNIFEYVKEYVPQLKADNQNRAFFIGSEKDMRIFLYGIQEKFYTKVVTKEKVLANSTQPIEQ